MRSTLVFTILIGLIAISMAFPAPEDEISITNPANLIAVDGEAAGEHDNASERKVRQFGFGHGGFGGGGFGGHRGGFGGGGFGGHRGFGGGGFGGHGGFGGGGFGGGGFGGHRGGFYG